jgi:hypothetical protein
MPEPRPAATVRSASNARSDSRRSAECRAKPAGMHAIPDPVLEQPAGDQGSRPSASGGRGPSPNNCAVPRSCRDRSTVFPIAVQLLHQLVKGHHRMAGRGLGARIPRRRQPPLAAPRSKNLFEPRRGGTISATMRLRSVITTVSPEGARRTYWLSLFFNWASCRYSRPLQCREQSTGTARAKGRLLVLVAYQKHLFGPRCGCKLFIQGGQR